MKRLYKLLLPLSIATTTVTSQAAAKTTKHTIKNGETLYTIAHANHTTIEEVRKANGLKKDDNLKIGRVLTVPQDTYIAKKKAIKNSTAKTTKHTIKSGETLYTIAHANHTTIEEVRKANGLKKGDNLKIGRVLTVPQDTYVANITKKKVLKVTKKNKKSSKHVVKSGDSLFAIALANNTTVDRIRKANSLKKGETLKLGRVLTLPGSKYSTSVKKKKIKMAKTKSNRNERNLAKALRNPKFKKMAKYSTKKSSKFSMSDIIFSGKGSKKSMKMIKIAKNKLGRRYVWGAVGQKDTYDCSGLTSYVCKKNGIKIPRRAIQQSKYGKKVARKNLKPGDLIFFDTSKRRKGYVNHVGIYIGHNKFIHASSAKKKVIITSLSKPFYSQRFKVARRVTS